MKTKNAQEVLENVNKLIEELEHYNAIAKKGWISTTDFDTKRLQRIGWTDCKQKMMFKISAIYDDCNIFDWWSDTLSLSQLKSMRSFLKTAIKLGFTGYVCFKVGAAGCAHGMWAHKNESTDGYSPKGDFLYHSFRAEDCYWDVQINGNLMTDACGEYRYKWRLADVKKALGA